MITIQVATDAWQYSISPFIVTGASGNRFQHLTQDEALEQVKYELEKLRRETP